MGTAPVRRTVSYSLRRWGGRLAVALLFLAAAWLVGLFLVFGGCATSGGGIGDIRPKTTQP